MRRFKPSQRFIDQVTSADHQLRQKIYPALKRLCANPYSKGVNLEPIKGRKGVYSARVTRSIRLLLIEREDDEGSYLEIVRYGNHDETY